MMASTHPQCYGGMFPDLSRPEYNRPFKGKAFVVEARSLGIGVSEYRMTIDPAAWEACLACPDYQTCYDLSMAKMLVYRELRNAF